MYTIHIVYRHLCPWYIYRDPQGQVSVKQNLENLLDLKLPQPEASQEEVKVVVLLLSNYMYLQHFSDIECPLSSMFYGFEHLPQ